MVTSHFRPDVRFLALGSCPMCSGRRFTKLKTTRYLTNRHAISRNLDFFACMAHRSGAREMLWQRGACNGPGTRPARMGKASQSTVDVLYTQGLKLDRISACASARRIASAEKEPRLAKTRHLPNTEGSLLCACNM